MPGRRGSRVIFSSECVTIERCRVSAEPSLVSKLRPHPGRLLRLPEDDWSSSSTRTRGHSSRTPPSSRSSNRRQAYQRRLGLCRTATGATGSPCVSDLLRAAPLSRDPTAAEAERLIQFTHARADASHALEQRRLFIDAADPAGVDDLDAEERVVALLDRVLTLARYTQRPGSRTAARAPSATELAEAAKARIAPRVAQRLNWRTSPALMDCSDLSSLPIVPACNWTDPARLSRGGAAALAPNGSQQGRARSHPPGARQLLATPATAHFTAAFHRSFGMPSAAAQAFDSARLTCSATVEAR